MSKTTTTPAQDAQTDAAIAALEAQEAAKVRMRGLRAKYMPLNGTLPVGLLTEDSLLTYTIVNDARYAASCGYSVGKDGKAKPMAAYPVGDEGERLEALAKGTRSPAKLRAARAVACGLTREGAANLRFVAETRGASKPAQVLLTWLNEADKLLA